MRAVVIDDRADEHVATVAEGGWTVRVQASERLVRFTDAEDELVAQPLPPGARSPVQDAPEPCPVCGAVAWLMIGDAVSCERCGHGAGSVVVEAVAGGQQISFHVARLDASDEDDEDEFDEGEADESKEFVFDAEAYHRGQGEVLASLSFPVYAVSGYPASAGGRFGGIGEVFVHQDPSADDDDVSARLSVSTVPTGEPRIQTPREALIALLDDGAWHDRERSPGGMLVAIAHLERSARRRVANAKPVKRRIVIDGRPEPFVFLGVDDAWVATREHHGVDVTVSARAVDPDGVSLEPLLDPAHAETGTRGDVERRTERARRDAAGELLSRAEVGALIAHHGLSAHRGTILAAIRPGFWLLPADSGRSRIGGLPDLAPGEQWPHDQDGVPYTLVAQIDCSALPPIATEFPLPPWAHNGALVRIFAALLATAPEPGPAVALACPADAPVTRAELPARPDQVPADVWGLADDSLRMLHELPVRLVPFLSAQAAWYAGIPEEATDAYEEFARRLAAGGGKPPAQQWQFPHLLGHGENLQGEDLTATGADEKPEVPREQWCTLINIPEHQGMSFGDGGGLAIVIPGADLAAGRYDRLVTDISMY